MTELLTMQRQPQCSVQAWARSHAGDCLGREAVRCTNPVVPGMTSCSSCLAFRFSQPRLSVVESRR